MKRNIVILGLAGLFFLLRGSVLASPPNFLPAIYADWSTVDANPIGNRMPLILIHGIQEDTSIWDDFLRNCWAANTSVKNSFKPYVLTYCTGIPLLSPGDPTRVSELATFLGSCLQKQFDLGPAHGFNGRPFAIVAHSMGGLIARSMMANYRFTDRSWGGDKTAVLITLATPHHGTPCANDGYVYGQGTFLYGSSLLHPGDLLFNCHPDFLLDLSWDSYDGKKFGGYSYPDVPSDRYNSQIIAIGSTTMLPPLSGLFTSWVFLGDHGYVSDGIVPIGSALFSGKTLKNAYLVDGSCDHQNIYNHLQTVGGLPLFNVIANELLSVTSLDPLPVISTVNPASFIGLSLPQTTHLTISGSGFTSTSTLTFNDGVKDYSGRIPHFVSPTLLTYDVAVGTQAATWNVKVVNGALVSAPYSFNVLSGANTTPPSAPIGLAVSPSAISRENLFYLSWQNPADVSGIARVWVKIGSPPMSDNDGSPYDASVFNPLPVSLTVSEGSQPVYLWLEDGAGNKSRANSSSVVLTLAGTKPTIAITSPTVRSSLSATQSPLYLSGVYGDNLSGVSTITWGSDRGWAGQASTVGNPTTGTWSSGAINLASGTNNIAVVASDVAGNIAAATVQVIYLDAASSGSVGVNISPSAAVSAGAQWRVNGGPWYASGTVVANVPTGSAVVDFMPVSGWLAPSSSSVSVNASQTGLVLATYSTVVVTQPPNQPSNPNPATGTMNASRGYPVFSWAGGSANGPVSYMFLLGTNSNLTANNAWWSYGGIGYTNTSVEYYGYLDPARTYYWRVLSFGDSGLVTTGAVWNFTTAYSMADFVPTYVGVNGNIIPGSNVDVVATVLNQGTLAYPNAYVRIYLSSTPGAKENMLTYSVCAWTGTLQPGQSCTVTQTVVLTGLQAGQSFLDVWLDTTAYGPSAESNYDNNIKSLAISYVDGQAPVVTYAGLLGLTKLKTGITNTLIYAATDDVGVQTVDIYYATDGGLSWTPIVEGHAPLSPPAYGDTYPWYIQPGMSPTTNLLIRIVARDASGNCGEKIVGPYTVLDGTSPQVTILSPSVGTVWDMGATYDVTWSLSAPNGIGYMWLVFYHDNTATVIADITTNTTGHYSWTIPNNFATTTGQLEVDLHDNNGNQTNAWSGGYFTVRDTSAPPPAPWTTPQQLTSLATNVSGGDTLPHIATDGAGNVHMVYLSNVTTGSAPQYLSQTLFYMKRSNGSWASPQSIYSVTQQIDGCAGYYMTIGSPGIVVSSQGVPHVVWSTTYSPQFAANNQADVFYSTIQGGTWTSPSNLSAAIVAPFSASQLAWSPKAPLPYATTRPTVASVNGVLYALGVDSTCTSMYAYDPQNNLWASKASLPSIISQGAAAEVNGKLYAIDDVSARIMIYNPANNSWSWGAQMLTPRAYFNFVSVSGKIFALSGGVNGSTLNEMYDPAIDSWTSKTPIPDVREVTCAAAVGSKIYMIGGEINGYYPTNPIIIYDTIQNAWSSAPVSAWANWPKMTQATAVSLSNKVFVIGGYDNPRAVEEYDPATFSLIPKTPIQTGRFGAASGVINGQIIVIGGMTNQVGNYMQSTELASVQFPPSGEVSDMPQILLDGSGNVNVFWRDGFYWTPDGNSNFGADATGTSCVYHITKVGNSWTLPEQVTTQSVNSFAAGVLSNVLHVISVQVSTNIVHQDNSSGSWSLRDATALNCSGVYYPFAAVDRSNQVYFTYDEVTSDGNCHLQSAVWSSAGWSTSESFVDESASTSPWWAKYPKVAVDSVCNPYFLWEDGESSGNCLVYCRRDGSSWTPRIQLNMNSEHVDTSSSSAALSTVSNELHAVWTSSVNGHSEVFYNHAFVNSTNDIYPPSVSVTAPASGSSLAIGTTFNIQWSAIDDSAVAGCDLAYTTNSGISWVQIASNIANSGTYRWLVPNIGSATGQVRVVARDPSNNTGAGYSALFSVADLTPPTITLLGSTSTVTFVGGATTNILWQANDNVGVIGIELDYSLNNGGTWFTIVKNTPNMGSYTWTVPNSVTPSLLFRASATDAAGFMASTISVQPISIVHSNTPPIQPYDPFPLTNGVGVPLVGTVLQWLSGDVDGDSLTFYIHLGTNTTPAIVGTVSQTSFSLGLLQPSTRYYWQVEATDGMATTVGPLWSFVTESSAMIIVQANPANGGSVIGGGTFFIGSNILLTATASNNWLFTGWNDGTLTNQYTITVPPTNISYTASFAPAATITVGANTNAGGSVTGSGTFLVGSTNTITATASNGWAFTGWNDGITNNPRLIVVASNLTYMADFAQASTVTVLASPTNGGSVAGGGTYLSGTNITISATPSNAWRFVAWSDGVTNSSRVVTVPVGGTSYTAVFTSQTLQPGVNVLVNGDFEYPSVTNNQYGSGYFTLLGWNGYQVSGAGVGIIYGSSAGLAPLSGSHQLVLNGGTAPAGSYVEQIVGTVSGVVYEVTFGVGHSGTAMTGLQVQAQVFGATNGVLYTHLFVPPSTVGYATNVFLFTANAASAKLRFTDQSAANPSADMFIDAVSVTAYARTVTTLANPVNAGSVTGSGINLVGGNLTLTATASNSWLFTKWNNGVTNNPYTITVPATNITYTANFAVTATVSVVASPPNGGSVTGGGIYQAGSGVRLIATASNGWLLAQWNDGNTSTSRLITMPPTNITYTATFGTAAVVTVQSASNLFGTVTGSGSYLVGGSAQIAAQANLGWRFLRWSDGNTSNPRTFTVGASGTNLTANFAVASHVYMQDQAGNVTKWAVNNQGTLQQYATFGGMGAWSLKAAGDVTHDGQADLFWQMASGWVVAYLSQTNSAYQGVSLGNLGAWELRAVADVDGDGIADLIWQLQDPRNGWITVWLMNSNCTQRSAYSLGNLGVWRLKGAGDINGDGKADLILQTPMGDVVVWLSQPGGGYQGLGVGNLGAWELRAVHDVDGDGIADLLWQNPGGWTVVWYMTTNGTVRAGMGLGNIFIGTTTNKIMAVE